MLFSSLLFLYCFLPFTLLLYYLSPGRIKNYVLLLCSLVFFAWGGVSFTALLLLSIVANYGFGLLIQSGQNSKAGRSWLILGVSFNLLLLGIYKYSHFAIDNLNVLFNCLNMPLLKDPGIVLPVGISFYTFHSLSYLVDISRGKVQAQRNIFDLALYICMFSQLIAGPIIRYSDVHLQLRSRQHTLLRFGEGIERFLMGLAKKVLLANTLAQVADELFTRPVGDLNASLAWLGMISYSLQIYFDFAGYSDMAIGLGKMFGFEFMENFNFPYIARSVKEFWRRWHMSLSGFFRDYVYIPLGGNQGGKTSTYINLILVFFLTGFWHGASWTFVVWGLFHGLFMLLERAGLDSFLNKAPAFVSRFYTLVVVMLAWVLFRADSFEQAIGYWEALLNFSSSPEQTLTLYNYLNKEILLVLSIALAGALGWFRPLDRIRGQEPEGSEGSKRWWQWIRIPVEWSFYLVLIGLCTLYLVAGTYNPFIYYRF